MKEYQIGKETLVGMSLKKMLQVTYGLSENNYEDIAVACDRSVSTVRGWFSDEKKESFPPLQELHRLCIGLNTLIPLEWVRAKYEEGLESENGGQSEINIEDAYDLLGRSIAEVAVAFESARVALKSGKNGQISLNDARQTEKMIQRAICTLATASKALVDNSSSGQYRDYSTAAFAVVMPEDEEQEEARPWYKKVLDALKG